MSAPSLRSLNIENFGLIRTAQIPLSEGLCVFSGETGSGKTMLLGSLAFALGARASADVVSAGAAKAVVSLELDLDAPGRAVLEAAGYAADEGEPVVVVREMAAPGKSSARINGRPAPSAVLRESFEAAVDFVGQHEAQRLLAPARHLDLLDRFAGDEAWALRENVADAFARMETLAAELAELEAGEAREVSALGESREVLAAIDGAQPEPGEDVRLRARRELLGEAERVTAALAAAREALGASDDGALDRAGRAVAALSRVARLSPALETLHAQAAEIESLINEAAAGLARELEATEFDPAELDAIAERLDLLDRLKRRFGGSIESALEARARAAAAIDGFEARDERVAAARGALAGARDRYARAAADLGARRAAAARELETRVARELRALAMPAARFEVAIEPLERPGARGTERAEFVLAPNAGEAPRPLARSASGGELSRVLLALVVASADPSDRRTLVFDEIDAGVGGATALAVGERLAALARTHQVICVTHLAQIASWADTHFTLRKREDGASTVIDVVPLASVPDVEAEIARMLSGSGAKVALEHAGTLLRDARERKRTRVRV